MKEKGAGNILNARLITLMNSEVAPFGRAWRSQNSTRKGVTFQLITCMGPSRSGNSKSSPTHSKCISA